MIKRFLFEAFDCYVSLFYLAFVQVCFNTTYFCVFLSSSLRLQSVLVVGAVFSLSPLLLSLACVFFVVVVVVPVRGSRRLHSSAEPVAGIQASGSRRLVSLSRPVVSRTVCCAHVPFLCCIVVMCVSPLCSRAHHFPPVRSL